MTTRLLVGIFTPAIRATDFSPVTGLRRAGLSFDISGGYPQTRTRRPTRAILGSGIVSNDPLDDRLLGIEYRFVNRFKPFARFFVTFLTAFLLVVSCRFPIRHDKLLGRSCFLGSISGQPYHLRTPNFDVGTPDRLRTWRISRVTSSTAIMPSTVSSLPRSE